jgi:hypothetical protein
MKLPRLPQLALGLASLFVLCLPAHSQFLRVGFSGSIAIDKLETMNDTLQIADPASRLDLLKRLGIDASVAEAATSHRFPHDIEIQPIHKDSGKSYGIVSLPCGVQNQAFLYLLHEDDHNKWHAVDYVALDCFHETPSYHLMSFSPGEDDIFVHHAHSGHGSDELEDKSTLYTIRNNRLHETLSTPDYISRADTSNSAPIEQTSTFLQLPGHLIEETRITSQNGLPLRAERRLWNWQTKQQIFSKNLFHDIPK